ncbi:MAG TPA: thiamine-phosphate kinase [Candidatus Binatia bacterium]|nr:thiamine-phosphate kinase [Candidatus Binatia bacterium]
MPADEFEVIRKLFAPLATDAGARGLADDAAVLKARGDLVVTTDTIVEGVHFLANDPIETVASKALRVNISDVVAKGAKPTAALLSLTWPKARSSDEIGLFANSLARELKYFGVSLVGGDTTSTPGPLTVTMTLFGEPLGERTPSRADAKVGEDVWLIGGEIGSAWMGLQLRTGAMKLDEIRRGRDEHIAGMESEAAAPHMPPYLTIPGEEFDAEAAWLMSLYLAPFVRLECAPIVAQFAGASMDVSDGLVADAQKLAAASGVALRIAANEIPFSIPAQRWAETGGDFRKLVTGGDDFVVLFTAPASARDALLESEKGAALRLSRIGVVEAGEGVMLVDKEDMPIPIPDAGYSHQLGR